MDRERLLQIHHEVMTDGENKLAKKNHDYTSNSDDALANFRGAAIMGVHPVIGILVRCMDKFMRIRSFIEQESLQVKDENVYDSIVDTTNYMVIAAAYIEWMRTQNKEDDFIDKELYIPIGPDSSSGGSSHSN
jgi:hypothetical protein